MDLNVSCMHTEDAVHMSVYEWYMRNSITSLLGNWVLTYWPGILRETFPEVRFYPKAGMQTIQMNGHKKGHTRRHTHTHTHTHTVLSYLLMHRSFLQPDMKREEKYTMSVRTKLIKYTRFDWDSHNNSEASSECKLSIIQQQWVSFPGTHFPPTGAAAVATLRKWPKFRIWFKLKKQISARVFTPHGKPTQLWEFICFNINNSFFD